MAGAGFWGWCTSEIGAALTFTGRRADAEFVFALDMVEKLPQVFAALRCGLIDVLKARGGVVEVHVRAAVLTELGQRTGLPSAWVPVVSDIVGRYGERGVLLRRLCGDPQARFPGARLRRHVQMRDRNCVAPGCRRPARKSDQDHTADHRRGGATVPANLDPLCSRHHLMKHEWGWRLIQYRPGLFRWRSPLRQIYWTRGEPIAADLPDPIPGPADGAGDETSQQPDVRPPPIFDPRRRRGWPAGRVPTPAVRASAVRSPTGNGPPDRERRCGRPAFGSRR